MKPVEYIKLFETGVVESFTGLWGRVISGKTSQDLISMADDSSRDLVMIMDSDGLGKFLYENGYNMLVKIGHDKTYIQWKLEKNSCYKLIVFDGIESAKLATWDNIFTAVSRMYPQVVNKLAKNLPDLRRASFKEIETAAGYRFSEVAQNGKTDERFMTVERFEISQGGLIEARAFLYFTVYLRELFSGDGYTHTANGQMDIREYIFPNQSIESLSNCVVIDLDVRLPAK